MGGQEAAKATAGTRELDSAAPVEKFGQPIVLMEGPSSINWATPASTALFAGGRLQWTTQADLHMAAAHTMASVSAHATGLFTYEGGIQAVAANGPVSVQSHTDQLEILADKAITIVSVNDVIEIKANEKIVLQSGQSSVTLEGGNITFACPGNFSVKGGQHIFDGGASMPPKLPALPEGELEPGTLYLDHRYHDDQPLAGAEYTVKLADGTERKGKLDGQGRAVIPNIPGGSAEVTFGPMPGSFERVDKTPMPNHDPAPSPAKIDQLFAKYFDSSTVKADAPSPAGGESLS